jgi:hypothetical protein
MVCQDLQPVCLGVGRQEAANPSLDIRIHIDTVQACSRYVRHSSSKTGLYFTKRQNVLIVMLAGGDKSTQARDIKRAEKLLQQLELE